ncbi:MAG: hypothetical protein PWP65_1699 [Clostridia bacterium]|nr:hypothetical protein [Clostridia bacterium]
MVIPAYNEAPAIGDTVRAAAGIPGVTEIWVVDDGSDDATAEIAAAAGAEVIRLKRNSGKGAALNAAAAYLNGQAVLLLDADVGSTAREGEKLLRPLWSGEADLVVGRFSGPAPGSPGEQGGAKAGLAAGEAVPRHAAGDGGGLGLVKGLARWGVQRLTGRQVGAVLSGQRAMWHRVWEAILPFPAGFGVEVVGTVRALRRGFRLKEVEVEMTHKATGRDWAGFYHRGRQFLHVGAALLSCLSERGEGPSS